MKRTNLTLLMAIMLLTTMFSCKKEAPVTTNEIVNTAEKEKQLFAENAALDMKIDANITTFTKDELEKVAKEKYLVIWKIKQNHPGITFEQIYPPKKTNNITYMSRDCKAEFSTARTYCNVGYLASSFASVGEGFIIGALFPPVGVAVGTTGVIKATYQYAICMNNANTALANCK